MRAVEASVVSGVHAAGRHPVAGNRTRNAPTSMNTKYNAAIVNIVGATPLDVGDE